MNDEEMSLPVPRIEFLRVANYRALRNLELRDIQPLTVFLGPNGSGKSTIFDVFAFLSECFSVGLRMAWDKRGRFKELRSRGSDGPILIELKYREKPGAPLITYHLAIEEAAGRPFVAEEWLQWRRFSYGKPFQFLDFRRGSGRVVSGEAADESDERVEEELDSPDMLAVNTLGQFAKHPRVSALRRFITGWYLSYLSADSTRGIPVSGAQERIAPTGDNLPNVIQYLSDQHPERLRQILDTLSRRVPRLERVDAEIMPDGRLLLQIKDSPFFVNGLNPEELWVLYRDSAGYTQAKRADHMRGIPEFVEHGAKLGQLWMEGHFEFGDPLTASGGPKVPGSKESAHGSRGASG